MKKIMLLCAILIQPFLWGVASEQSFYMGEMKCQYAHEDVAEHFGIFFMKRVSSPDEMTMTDSCVIASPEEGTFSFVHVSLLQEDPNEFVVSNPNSEFFGEGELVGFPWDWTTMHERLEFDNEGSVSIEVENKRLENGLIHSKAKIFFGVNDEEEPRYFATFSTYLYPIDPAVVQLAFQNFEEDNDGEKELLTIQ